MLRPRRAATRSRTAASREPFWVRCTASTAAQRTSRLPCLVIRPRCTVVSARNTSGSTRPGRQLPGSIEAVHVADLGNEHRPQDRTHHPCFGFGSPADRSARRSTLYKEGSNAGVSALLTRYGEADVDAVVLSNS